jgi:hypothetical protein
MAARTGHKRMPKGLMPDTHRVKIQNSNILNALVEHTLGKRDMSATQVSAGIALLRKIMPDLAAVEHQGEVQGFVMRIPEAAATTGDWELSVSPALAKPEATKH